MCHLEEERVQAAQILLQYSVKKEAHLSVFARFEVSLLLKHQPWAVQMRSVLVSVEEKVQAW